MYKVIQHNHSKYGNVVEVSREEVSQFETPFQAINKALTLKRLWAVEGKVRYLVAGQIMSSKQMETWANEEYKSLPKCENCAKILDGDVFTNTLSPGKLFCTQLCADKDFKYQTDKLLDEEEFECF